MEEFNYKFSQNCSILTLNGISNLVSKIKVLHKSTNVHEFNKHYKYLREQCVSPKNSVASSAAVGLMNLTESSDEIVPLNTVIKDVMSAVANVENMSGIIDLIFYALFSPDLFTSYDIMRNQHPLITVLKKNQSCWPHIVAKIEDKFRTESKTTVLQKLQPFALFVLYDYEQKLEQVLQLELLSIYNHYLDNVFKQKVIILSLPHIPRSLRYLKVMLNNTPELLTYVISAIYVLMQNDQDATEAIWALHKFLTHHSDRDYSLELAMVSDCLPLAPVAVMDTLCECIMIMLVSQKYSTLVTNTLKSSLFCWKMLFASTPTLKQSLSVNSMIDEVLIRQFEHNDVVPSDFLYLDEKQYVYTFVLNHEFTTEFIDGLEAASPQILEMIFTLILGNFNDDNETDVTLRMLRLCMRACKVQPRYTNRLLPVLLHKISSVIQPELHLELLRCLPQMGVLKENISTIVMTIKAISATSVQMLAFAISLMADLVFINKICFPYLEELLSREVAEPDSELVISKAFVVREMCLRITTHGLEIYRKELASFVSRALMKTMDNNLVIAFSFESLKYLCHGFDPYTTWQSLEQRFAENTSDRIVVGMCGIMGEVARMADVTDQKCEEVVKKLFAYTQFDPSAAVLEAAYAALSNFTLEQIAVGFPALYMHITNDNSILGSLAGACWVNLLQFGPRAGLQAAADMLICFIHVDMKTYKRANYEVTDGQQEPLHMTLTRDNVLAAVAKFVKKYSSKLSGVDRDVYRECLRILATRYVRPFPPMDWTFLGELSSHADFREYVVAIASRQSSVSGSARRFIENFIKHLTEKNAFGEDVIYVYNNLDQLFNTIQPIIMKPFFKKTLKLGVMLMSSSTKEIDLIATSIQAMLKSPAASESNKASAAEVLLVLYDSLKLDSDTAEKVLSIIGCVPKSYLNDYSPVQFETVNDQIMLRCLAIHCATAEAEDQKPFANLDCVVDCRILKSCVQPAFKFEKMYVRLAPVFVRHNNHPTLPAWLTELASKINIELAERKDMRNVIFATSVFIIAVVVSSGYHIFTGAMSSLDEFSVSFPYALNRLLHAPSFAPYACQILESMYDFTTNKSYRRNVLSEQISQRFKHALLMLRSHESFNERLAWMKYVEVNL